MVSGASRGSADRARRRHRTVMPPAAATPAEGARRTHRADLLATGYRPARHTPRERGARATRAAVAVPLDTTTNHSR